MRKIKKSAFIVLTILLSLMVLSVFGKENPSDGQPFQGILDAIDGMKESITGQLDSLFDAIIGNITESQEEIQSSISASEDSIKDAILQAETEIVSSITDARDEISSKIDNIQYDGLMIKSKYWYSDLALEEHTHYRLDLSFSEPTIVKAIYLVAVGLDIDLHFYEANVLLARAHGGYVPYHLDIKDYNPEIGSGRWTFEVLNKFDLHEIALRSDSVFSIYFEAGAKTYPWELGIGVTIVYESTIDSVCEVDCHMEV